MKAIIVITLVAIINLLIGVRGKKKILLPFIFFGLTVAIILNLSEWGTNDQLFGRMLNVDPLSLAFSTVLMLVGVLIFMFAGVYYKGVVRPLEDIYALILFAISGGIIMTGFNDLILFFIGLETLSISFYILAGSKKFDILSNEAAMKYFLSGSFATGFLLFGIALVYGASGTFNLVQIKEYLMATTEVPNLFKVGMLLIFVGMLFKISAVPFHFWSPDVYTGSPTLITAFMTTAGKIASFGAFYRLITIAFLPLHESLTTTFTVLAIITILVGNFGAIYQDNIKRMLAYSGIAQSGYLMIAIIALGEHSLGIILYFVLSYIVATTTAFAVLMFIREEKGSFSVRAYTGLAKHNPIEALAMAMAMMSLAGIPPLAGFMAKYNLFILAAEQGHIGLVAVAVFGSLLSIYFYFRPIAYAYFSKVEDQPHLEGSRNFKINLLVCTALMILMGFLPGLIINLF